MSKRQLPSDDYDSPWKETLQRFLRPFLEFFFPAIAADIDWSRGYESLDKEFQQIIRRAKLGKALADKLFKVYLRDGSEHWLLIHIEVQGRRDQAFPQRMFRYNIAAFSLYNHAVISLAVLTDEERNWRPSAFAYGRWGSQTSLQFPVAKLLDFLADPAALAASSNPLAAVVLAQSQALATRHDPQTRRQSKLRLVKGLYERGWSEDDVRELFRIIDWLMDLPDEIENAFRADIAAFEEERTMRYVTSIERLARKEGHQEGHQEGHREGHREGHQEGLLEALEIGLEARFGAEGQDLVSRVRAIRDEETLRALLRLVLKGASMEEMQRLLPNEARGDGGRS